MLESFVLVLTLCGGLHTGGYTCENFVIDTKQTEISCLQGVQGVYNRDNKVLLGLIDEASNDWFKTITSNKLTCIQEDKE